MLTTIGVNMMLDTIKEKKDSALREEIKDRLNDSLQDSQRRIFQLESKVSEIVSPSILLFSRLKLATMKK